DQIILQLEANAERLGHFAFGVAQNREAKLVVALRLAAVRRSLRRDRDKTGTPGGDFRKRVLQRLEFEVAIRAPDAAIERDDQWPLREQFARRNKLAVGI